MKYKIFILSDPVGFETDIVWIEPFKEFIETIFEEYYPNDQYEIEHSSNYAELDTRDYDILFFDWGGMSFIDYSLKYLTFKIITLAENNPNKKYVLISVFTTCAFRDAKREFGNNLPFNIYLDMDYFVKDFIKGK
jgi:hypothetical protein